MDNFLKNTAYSFNDIIYNYKVYDFDSVTHHFYYKDRNLGYIQTMSLPGGRDTRICLILNGINTDLTDKGGQVEIETEHVIVDKVKNDEKAFVHKTYYAKSQDYTPWYNFLEPRIQKQRVIEEKKAAEKKRMDDMKAAVAEAEAQYYSRIAQAQAQAQTSEAVSTRSAGEPEPMGNGSTSTGGKRSSKKRKSSRKQKSRRKNNKKRKTLKRKNSRRFNKKTNKQKSRK